MIPAVRARLVLSLVGFFACTPASGGEPGASPPSSATATDEGASCVIAKFKGDPKAPETCTRQCEKGDAESCTTVGAMYEQGHLVPARDETKAKTSYARGCDLGDWMGCNGLGKVARDTDPKAALRAFERVCKGGNQKDFSKDVGAACGFTGIAYAEGKLVAKDEKRATEDLSRACGLGHIESCNRLDFKAKR